MSIRRRFPVGPVTAPAKGPAELSPIANSGSNRYQYPTCFVLSRLSSLIQIPEFSERPIIVPHEVLSGLNVVARALSPNKLYFFIFSNSGLKGSFFFISVHAIISSLPASFTLILVLMPFSFSRPLSFSINQEVKCLFLVEAIRAAWYKA